MKKYQVWDKLNSEQSDATTIEASSPSNAAEEYADCDYDGACDGIYINGHPIMVHDGTSAMEFEVNVESVPSYHATPTRRENA